MKPPLLAAAASAIDAASVATCRPAEGRRAAATTARSLTVLALAALVAGVPAIADAADYKIGFVNTERLFREAAPAKRAQQKLEKEFAARDAEIQKITKQVRDLQTSLDKDGATMAETERRNKERDLANLSRDLQRSQREFREDLNLRRNEELAGIQERANKVILQIAEAEKYDLILQDPVVYASQRIDITEKVIKALADK
jgi:outer membrane protein